MKKFLWILLAIVALGAVAYLYVFHKPHRDISGESAAETLSAEVLVSAYKSSQSEANAQYLDQVIEVQGEVAQIDGRSVMLEAGVNCNMLPEVSMAGVAYGQERKIKGRVVGFDELFGEVRLDNCSFVDEASSD